MEGQPVVETAFNNWLDGKHIDWQKLGHEAKIGAMSGAVTGIMANGAHELIRAKAEGSFETSQTPPPGAATELQVGLDRMNAVDNEAVHGNETTGGAASGSPLSLDDKIQLMRENGYTQDDIDNMNHKEFNDTVVEVQQFETMKQPQTPPLEETPQAPSTSLDETPEEPQTPEGKDEAEAADDQVRYKLEEKESQNTPVYETQSYASPEAAGEDGEGEKGQDLAPTDKQKTAWPELESQLKALGYTNEELDGMSFRDTQALVDSRQAEALGGKTEVKNPDSMFDTSYMSKPDVKVTRLDDRMFGDVLWKARDEAEDWAKENLQRKTFVNEDSGWGIDIASKGIKKIRSGDRLTPLDHLEAVRAIPDLIKNAVLAETRPDRDNNPDIKNIHIFYAPLEIDGKLYRAKLTVMESANSKKFYDHSLTELEKPAGTRADDTSSGS
ncbi:MAG: hypothetical protein HQK98_11845, partial [Nitrospirae bacterium]|nr:hypothetical protein [Nitrospirota bacterium]